MMHRPKVDSIRKREKCIYLWRMDADWSICSIGLFTLDAFDVNYKFLSVDLHHFSNCVTLVMTTDNLKQQTTKNSIPFRIAVKEINEKKKFPFFPISSSKHSLALHHLCGLACYEHCTWISIPLTTVRSLIFFECVTEHWNVAYDSCSDQTWRIYWISCW